MKRVALVLLLLLSTVTVPGTAVAASPRWVMGYYVGYQRALMPANQIEWGTLTHLVVGPVNPRSDGTLDKTFDIDATHGPAMARDLAQRAKAHGVVPMLMIGGAGNYDQWVSAASHHLGRLVDNLVATMRDLGYSGLDLDWEPVLPSDRPHVTALVNALRSRLPNAVLTMPVGPTSLTFPHVPHFYGALSAKLNRIDVMTYGMSYKAEGWKTWHSSAVTGAGSSTPMAVDVSVRSYRAAGVPAAKLGVGIGFYGMCWKGGVTHPRQRIGSSFVAADDNVMSWVNIRNQYFRQSAYHYDTSARAAYLGAAGGLGPRQCTYVSYENGRSITAKAQWAKAHGLGALIVWTVNQGHLRGAASGHRDPLLRTARNAFGA